MLFWDHTWAKTGPAWATPKISLIFFCGNNKRRSQAFKNFLFYQNIISFDWIMNDFPWLAVLCDCDILLPFLAENTLKLKMAALALIIILSTYTLYPMGFSKVTVVGPSVQLCKSIKWLSRLKSPSSILMYFLECLSKGGVLWKTI